MDDVTASAIKIKEENLSMSLVIAACVCSALWFSKAVVIGHG